MKENHDHYIDAIAYAFKAMGKKLPWYKIWWGKLKRRFRNYFNK